MFSNVERPDFGWSAWMTGTRFDGFSRANTVPVVVTSVIRRRISSARIDIYGFATRLTSPVAPAPSPAMAKKPAW